ncbi:hypothetical protein SCHPADRAFT_908506 [Schizopora paradoxa]|uniref:RRM domain-containing protein n=1 Tax=Schizopora paradoxa TaxID=27342 RepID=A0A0H2RUW0_9AGAM|nr:hypothetical protein SCHPADRAFT_908506 [Schizopora paradoxa]
MATKDESEDLYADLYNDNETGLGEEPESDDVVPTTTSTTTSLSTTAQPAREKSPSPAPIPTVTSIEPKPATSNIQTVQSIPTYSSSENFSHDYDSHPQSSNDGQNQTSSLSIVDRHIRPSEMKEEGKMFIGGLNWDTTDEGLKKYFEQFGKVEACTIMRDATGRSRCFAFLTFEDPASVNAVMVREHYLDGKIIDPKRAIPRQEHQRAQKLFIGGLAATVTSDSMREFFSQYGKVIDSTVMLDRETGRSKGFGFVSFENANVDPILGFGKLEIDGKLIDVKLAQPRYARDGSGYENEGGAQGGQGGQGRGSYNNNSSSGGSGGGSYNQGGQGGAQASTPLDPQALAAFYTRIFQQYGGMGGMGGMGMGGMGMGGMGGMGMGMGGMGGGGMGGMGRGMGGGGGMSQSQGGGMGRGGMASQGPINAPRGPRGAPTGPAGGVGPQRSNQRGHSYHPYTR